MQIVVIDDEKDSLSLFSSHIIDQADISIQMFQKKHQAALNYIETHDVYAAFLDIVMPDVNGIDLRTGNGFAKTRFPHAGTSDKAQNRSLQFADAFLRRAEGARRQGLPRPLPGHALRE